MTLIQKGEENKEIHKKCGLSWNFDAEWSVDCCELYQYYRTKSLSNTTIIWLKKFKVNLLKIAGWPFLHADIYEMHPTFWNSLTLIDHTSEQKLGLNSKTKQKQNHYKAEVLQFSIMLSQF